MSRPNRAARRAAERGARNEERFRLLQSTLTDICKSWGPPPEGCDVVAVAYLVRSTPVVRFLDLRSRMEIVLAPGSGAAGPPLDTPTMALPLELPPAQPGELRAVLALADAYRVLSVSFREGPISINALGGLA